MSASFIYHFATLEDPRVERNQRHNFMDIILLTICAVVSGAEGWEAIEEFGHAKRDWLKKYGRFDHGLPSHDCIARVISPAIAQRLSDLFSSVGSQAVADATGGEIIAVDGKCARGSRDRQRDRAALHMVSAWACTNRLVLGQEATAEKSNEITAIPKLLALLELKGCIVTLDAMGCQQAIATQIHQQGGDYVLGLKGNQSTLQESVADFFTVARAGQFAGVAHAYHEELDKDHGRLEVRRYWISEELGTLPDHRLWAGLRSIGLVERQCTQASGRCVEQRYFLTSSPRTRKPLLPRCAATGAWKTGCTGGWT